MEQKLEANKSHIQKVQAKIEACQQHLNDIDLKYDIDSNDCKLRLENLECQLEVLEYYQKHIKDQASKKNIKLKTKAKGNNNKKNKKAKKKQHK